MSQDVALARHVALFRGINVGGRKKLAMADVRELLEALGHGDVETYLQSGNALFTRVGKDTSALAGEIEAAVKSRVGLELRVLVRTHAELAEVVAANPFREAEAEPSKLHVAFLSATPDPDRVATIDASRYHPDELQVGERVIYLWYPDGSGRSKLTNDLL